MSVLRQFGWFTISGDTEVDLLGQDVRFAPGSGNAPRLVGIVDPGFDGVEVAIHNLSGAPVALVHDVDAGAQQGQEVLSAPKNRLLMTGLGGDFSLPDGQVVWAIRVDPGDSVIDDSR